MRDKRTIIHLNTPKIEGNKIFLSWEQSPIFEESSYWIEYKGLNKLECRPDALLEAYLPVCIALGFLGDVAIALPGYVDPLVLQTWKKTCADTTRVLGKKTARMEFIVPDAPGGPPSGNKEFPETALLFGGGSEALLTLAHLLDREIAPLLVSLWGKGWIGSDPDTNPEKFDLEEGICREFRLKIIRIHTNLKTIFHKKNFRPYLRRKTYIIDAAFWLPIYVSVLLPVAQQLRIGTIVTGNEKELSSDPHYYSLSGEMSGNLNPPDKNVTFLSDLGGLTKMQILKELHTDYPRIAKYQYSCFCAVHERWCLRCEKCLRNYMAYKILDIDPITVGMDEAKMLDHFEDTMALAKKEIPKRGYHFDIWRSIREEALKQEKKRIAETIGSFYKDVGWRRFFVGGMGGHRS